MAALDVKGAVQKGNVVPGAGLTPTYLATRPDTSALLTALGTDAVGPRFVRMSPAGALVFNQGLVVPKGSTTVGLISVANAGWLTVLRSPQVGTTPASDRLVRLDDKGAAVWSKPVAGEVFSVAADASGVLLAHHTTQAPILQVLERFSADGMSVGATKIAQVVLGNPQAMAADGKGGAWLLETGGSAMLTRVLPPCPAAGCAPGCQ